MSRDVERLRRDWNELAVEDALWAVLAEPGRDRGRWGVDEFFATGEREIATVLAAADRLEVTPKYVGRGISVSERRIRRVVQTEPDGEWGLFYYVARASRAPRSA